MKHLSDEERLSFIEGNASSEVIEHVKTCAACEAEALAMRQSIEQLQTFAWPGRSGRKRVAAPIFR
jgi:hypothetical protein